MPAKQPKRGGRAGSGGRAKTPTAPNSKPAKQPLTPEPSAPKAKAAPSRRRTVITVVVLSVVTVALWMWTNRPTSQPDPAAVASANPNSFGPEVVDLDRIEGLPEELGHPVFWAGARADTNYELTIAKAGQVGIRYLAKSDSSAAADGGQPARGLTIATSPKSGAHQSAVAALATPGALSEQTPSGSLVFQDPAQPQVGFLVRPDMDYLISVFDPAAGQTWKLLSQDQVVPIGE